MTRLLTAKSLDMGLFFMVPVVYLDHGNFHPVGVLFFSKSVFRGGLKLLKVRGSIRKKVVHLHRRTRRLHINVISHY